VPARSVVEMLWPLIAVLDPLPAAVRVHTDRPPRPSRETEEEGPAGAGPLGILLLEIIYMMTIGGLIVRQCTAPGEVAVVVAIDTALNIEHKLREMRGGWRC